MSKFKVTKIPSQSFTPFLGYLFQNVALKVQGQGHSSRSHSGPNILSNYFPFIPCQSNLLFLIYSFFFFKIWPWKSKFNVLVRLKFKITKWSWLPSKLTSFSIQVNHPSHSWDMGFIKIWPWKSKVNVIAQSHIVGPTSYWLISFCSISINPPIPVTAFLKISSWKFKVKVMGEVKFKVTKWAQLPIDSYWSLTLKTQVQGHNSRSYSRSNILSTHFPFFQC